MTTSRRWILYRLFAELIVFAAGVTIVTACSVSGKVAGIDDNEAVTVEITRLERLFADATLRGDIASIERLLAPEFTGIDPNGRELSREKVLAGLTSAERRIAVLRHDNIRVRTFGDCAVVFAVTVMEGYAGEHAFKGEFPYLRVWIKRGGRWMAVATQSASGSR